MSSSDQDFAASEQLIANHAFYVLPDQDIKRKDILTLAGKTYEARGFIEPSDELYRKVLAEEIQTGT